MKGVDLERGITAASAAAGPLFALELISPLWMREPTISLSGIGSLLVILVYALIGGILLSIVPNAVGAAVLAALGRDRRWARSPFVWALSGTAFGWALGSLFGGNWASSLLAMNGCVCALICRWGTRWHD